MTGTDPATRARARTREEIDDFFLELPGRLSALSQEADLVTVRQGLVREVGEVIMLALTKKRSYVNKAGDLLEYDEPDFASASRLYETLGRWLLLDPDELIERSEKVRRAFERGRKAA